jgi:hypothetical protein
MTNSQGYDRRRMKRLVETSVGQVELDLTKLKIGGLNARVSIFGNDGWDIGQHGWSEQYSQNEALADVLEKAGLPEDEAARIASETLAQWKVRGGEGEDRDSRAVTFVGATFGFAALGLVALIAVVVWLVT